MFDYKTMIKLITRFSFFSYKNDNISVKPNKFAIIVYIYIYRRHGLLRLCKLLKRKILISVT